MQILEEWIGPILSLIGMLGLLILFCLTRWSAKSERENIAEQVRLYRKTQLENRLIGVIDEARELLRDVAGMLASYKTSDQGQFRLGILDGIKKNAQKLTRLSWRCGVFGKFLYFLSIFNRISSV